MSESPSNDQFNLATLAKRLVLEGMPVQTIIANEAGVSQSTVSRAVQGKIKTSSDGARRLWEYAAGRMGVLQITSEQLDRTRVSRPNRSGRRARNPLRDRSAASQAPQDRQRLADAAIAGLRDYLDDAFDPLLVIEQISMLRRAQDAKRSSRSKSAS
jgi:transcriptional regulator with XRE-family HTH domain